MIRAATDADQVKWEFAALAPIVDEPLMLIGLAAAAFVLTAVVVWLYTRERATVRWSRLILPGVLRVTALAGLVLFALGPQQRTAKEETRPSQVLLLVDDSLSMALVDSHESPGTSPITRAKAVEQLLGRGRRQGAGLISALLRTHQVHVAPISAPRDAVTLGGFSPSTTAPPTQGANAPDANNAGAVSPAVRISPSRPDTRLGDAIGQSLSAYAGAPLAAIVLLSDGQQNAGGSALGPAAAAGEAGAPIHTIGFGSRTPAINLAVREIIAPRRAYTNDHFAVTAMIEAQNLSIPSTRATLFVRRSDGAESQPVLLDSKETGVLRPNEAKAVTFEITPDGPGTFEYEVRVAAAPNERDTTDNAASAEVQVVDREIRVLVIAGGPMRDFRFLRTQLRRDDTINADVWLQSTTQQLDGALTSLPTTEDALAAYDVIVAFDADWTQVDDPTLKQIQHCVSDRGTGFLFVAGHVQTPRWLRSRSAAAVLTLLPVRPAATPLLASIEQQTSTEPTKVRLTRAGKNAQWLWVVGEREPSLEFWDEFPGFYSLTPVESIKQGAVVFAEGDGAAAGTAARPSVVFAEQFFGAGRSLFVGAPELWRLRAESPAAMTAFYTKLLQHLSQGRLMAQSPHGSLLFERDRYAVGDTLVLRATLTDDVIATLGAGAKLTAQVEHPDGRVEPVALAVPGESGATWVGSLLAETEGLRRARLTLLGVATSLSTSANVMVPALERAHTERNSEMLAAIAEASGGRYYRSADVAMLGGGGLPALPDAIPSKAETLIVYGAPDQAFARRISYALLGLIAGCLILEWAARRVLSLA